MEFVNSTGHSLNKQKRPREQSIEPDKSEYRRILTNNDGTTTTKFDTKGFIKAMQEYNTEKNAKMKVVHQPEYPENCEMFYGTKNDNTDILLKFKRQNYNNIECIYLSTLMDKFINNPCSMYIQWVSNGETQTDDGKGFKPQTDINELIPNVILGKLPFVYWKLPFFGGFFIDLNELIQIQRIVSIISTTGEKTVEKTIELIELENTGIRIGNIYGMFGQSMLHGQKHKHQIYGIVIDDNVDVVKLKPFFNFEKLQFRMQYQFDILNEAHGLSIDNGQEPELIKNHIPEEYLCPSIITTLNDFLEFYNNQHIVMSSNNKLIRDAIYKHASTDVQKNTDELLNQLQILPTQVSMTLNQIREVVKTNIDIRNKLLEIVLDNVVNWENISNTGGNSTRSNNTRNKSTRNKNTRNKSTRNKNTRNKQNTRNKNTRNKNTRNKNTRNKQNKSTRIYTKHI